MIDSTTLSIEPRNQIKHMTDTGKGMLLNLYLYIIICRHDYNVTLEEVMLMHLMF